MNDKEKSQSSRNREALLFAMDKAYKNRNNRPLWKRAILSLEDARKLEQMKQNFAQGR